MSYRAFKGQTNYFNTRISKTIEANLIEFINWGFINEGGYTDVDVPTSGAYGGDYSDLRQSNDPRYTTGTVFDAIRGNWVWESGMDYGSPNVPQVYVDNVLVTSGYNIDYIDGRVVFDTSQAGSSVTCSYSYKEVKVLSARNNPLVKTIQYLSRRPDDSNFLLNSGIHILLKDKQLQLPSVSIESNSRKSEGWQIGGGLIATNTTKCHILGENDYEVQQIADTLCDQEAKSIRLFSLDRMTDENAFPLTHNGYLSASPLSYHNLVEPTGVGGYLYNDGVLAGNTRIVQTNSQNGQWINQNLYLNTVTLVTESILLKT